jgi:DNA-binding transcriptional regulator LsrR (DeoR family)
MALGEKASTACFTLGALFVRAGLRAGYRNVLIADEETASYLLQNK